MSQSVTKTKRRGHITPILRPLHWLPVTYRTEFKVWLAEYKLVSFLRSAGAGQLVVPRVEAKQGEMAFSRYAAHCWNQLPMGIRSAPTLTCFKKKIKTALFSTAFNSSVGFMFVFVILAQNLHLYLAPSTLIYCLLMINYARSSSTSLTLLFAR